jgi:hypothetical protein
MKVEIALIWITYQIDFRNLLRFVSICFTNQWRAASLGPLTFSAGFSNASPGLTVRFLSLLIFLGEHRGFLKEGVKTYWKLNGTDVACSQPASENSPGFPSISSFLILCQRPKFGILAAVECGLFFIQPKTWFWPFLLISRRRGASPCEISRFREILGGNPGMALLR